MGFNLGFKGLSNKYRSGKNTFWLWRVRELLRVFSLSWLLQMMNLWFVSVEGDGELSTDDGSRICSLQLPSIRHKGHLIKHMRAWRLIFTYVRLAGQGLEIFFSPNARNFLFSKRVQTASGAHLASYPMGIGFRPRWQSEQGVKLTTHFYLVPRLRMNGAIPLPLLYAVITWTGKTLPVPLLLPVTEKSKPRIPLLEHSLCTFLCVLCDWFHIC